MTITFIATKDCPRVRMDGQQGEVAEILNRSLCGAENALGMLRWLAQGERLAANCGKDAHQLIYLMEGEAVITLQNKDYEVSKGAGVYLGPEESASIRHAGAAPLKLLHLVVPKARS